MGKKRFPIRRMERFYTQDDFSYENELAREFVEGDLNLTLVLFEVDKTQTSNVGDDIYGEVSGNKIKFKPPREINVKLTLEEAKTDAYSDGFVKYQDHGNLRFTIFTDHLKELGAEIEYGDYIGYPSSEDDLVYFTVVNDGRVNSDSSHTRFGYKSYYRTIVCTKADTDEFNPLI